MIETYYAGAYWAARREDATACARRAQSFLLALAHCSPLFSRWLIPHASRGQPPILLEPELPLLQQMLSRERVRNDEGGIIEDLGFRLYADTGGPRDGHPSEHAHLSIRCGSYTAPVGNSCVLSLPSQGPQLERVMAGTVLTKVLHAMALAWEPDWAVATSDSHRELALKRSAGTFTGWVMYFSHRRGSVPPLPAPVQVEPVEDKGTLITLTPERFTVSNPAHVELAAHVYQRLNEAGLLVPVNPSKSA